jgi:pyruvate dehydrogenase (quinone)
MTDPTLSHSRRNLLKLGGASAALLSAAAVAAQTGVIRSGAATTPAAPEPSTEAGTTEPQTFEAGMSTADILIDTLVRWDVRFVFGIVGDGINPLIEALRKREDRIRFIAVRHEEAAAFMACGYAKHTGKLGVCLATTGPGAVHLMNGLYDAKMDATPVLAITGKTVHDLGGTHFMQSVDT